MTGLPVEELGDHHVEQVGYHSAQGRIPPDAVEIGIAFKQIEMRNGNPGFVLDGEVPGKDLAVAAGLQVMEFLLDDLVEIDGLLERLVILGRAVEFT